MVERYVIYPKMIFLLLRYIEKTFSGIHYNSENWSSSYLELVGRKKYEMIIAKPQSV